MPSASGFRPVILAKPTPARPTRPPGNPTTQPHDDGDLRARVAALEADLAAVMADRRWLVGVIAGLAIDVERIERPA